MGRVLGTLHTKDITEETTQLEINADEPLVWLLLVTLLWGMVFLVMLWHNSAVLW
jgi:hypothetical protein